jgi:hypothetical protein
MRVGAGAAVTMGCSARRFADAHPAGIIDSLAEIPDLGAIRYRE